MLGNALTSMPCLELDPVVEEIFYVYYADVGALRVLREVPIKECTSIMRSNLFRANTSGMHFPPPQHDHHASARWKHATYHLPKGVRNSNQKPEIEAYLEHLNSETYFYVLCCVLRGAAVFPCWEGVGWGSCVSVPPSQASETSGNDPLKLGPRKRPDQKPCQVSVGARSVTALLRLTGAFNTMDLGSHARNSTVSSQC